jgi:hypothetical protein
MTVIGTVQTGSGGVGTTTTGSVVGGQSSGIGALGVVPQTHVGLLCQDLGVYITVPLNTAGVQPNGGGPQHDVTARIGRRGVAEYRGHDPLRLDLNILLDGYPNTSVDATINVLFTLATRMPREIRMPAIKLQGDQVPLSHRGRSWVMDGPIDYVDDPPSIRTGLLAGVQLVRQALVVHLLERVTDRLLSDSISRSKRQAKGQKKTPAIYTVKKGQVWFYDVSKAVYGNRDHGHIIAQFNTMPIGTRLTPGTRLRIP